MPCWRRPRRNLLKQGAKQSSLKVGGVDVCVFELPPPSEEQLPQASDGKTAAPAAARPASRTRPSMPWPETC